MHDEEWFPDDAHAQGRVRCLRGLILVRQSMAAIRRSSLRKTSDDVACRVELRHRWLAGADGSSRPHQMIWRHRRMRHTLVWAPSCFMNPMTTATLAEQHGKTGDGVKTE